jgi:hypothetical protein
MGKTNKLGMKRKVKLSKKTRKVRISNIQRCKGGSLKKKDIEHIKRIEKKIKEMENEIDAKTEEKYSLDDEEEMKKKDYEILTLSRGIKVLEKQIKIIKENKPVIFDTTEPSPKSSPKSPSPKKSLKLETSEPILSDVEQYTIKYVKEPFKKTRKMMPMIKNKPVHEYLHEPIIGEDDKPVPEREVKMKPSEKKERKQSLVIPNIDITGYLKTIGKRMTKKNRGILPSNM